MKSILATALALGLLSTAADATALYDRNGRFVPMPPGFASVTRGNVRYWYRHGVYAGYASRHGNVITVHKPNGTLISTIRNYGGGVTQSWDPRGRRLFTSR